MSDLTLPLDVAEADGTPIPAGSSKAAVCKYHLDIPDDPETGSRLFARVELRVEPDAEEARAEYRRFLEDVTEGVEPLDVEEIPELGEDGFYTEVFDVVYVLEDDTLLTVSYEAEDVPGLEDDPGEIKDTVIAIAKLAAARI